MKSCLGGAVVALVLVGCTDERASPSSDAARAETLAASEKPAMKAAAQRSSAASVAEAEQLLNFAEAGPYGALHFWPRAATISSGPFKYRQYATGVAVGVVVEDDPQYQLGGVYVLGGAFGDSPRYVGQVGAFIKPLEAPPPSELLTLSPAVLSVNQGEHLSAEIRVQATARNIDQVPPLVLIEDRGRVLESLSGFTPSSDGVAVGTLVTRKDLPRGIHEGALSIHLCKTPECTVEFPGSPVTLPYRIGVVRSAYQVTVRGLDHGSIGLTAKSGEPVTLTAEVSTSPVLTSAAYLEVRDSAGMANAIVPIAPPPAGSGVSRVTIPAAIPLTPGRYSGLLEFSVCNNSQCSERSGFGQVQYVVLREANSQLVDAAIGATPHLPPLRPLAGAAPWAGVQGGPRHAGYVPGQFDVAGFSLRWTWTAPDGTGAYLFSPQAAGHGLVAWSASLRGNYGPRDTELVVLAEADGAQLWRRSHTAWDGVLGPPALTADRVYALTAKLMQPSYELMAFDRSTGTAKLTVPIYSGRDDHSTAAPVVAGSRILVPASGGTGLSSVDAATGKLQWQAAGEGDYDHWNPSLDGAAAYTYFRGTVTAYNVVDGSRSFAFADAVLQAAPLAMAAPPHVMPLEDGRAFVVDKGSLVVFDLTSRRVLWRQDGGYLLAPAVQGGTVVAARAGGLLEARRAVDGTLLWSTKLAFGAPSSFGETIASDPVLTDNLVFASSAKGVFAISRADGSLRWFYGKWGKLAISPNGILTIAGGRQVTAINLH